MKDSERALRHDELIHAMQKNNEVGTSGVPLDPKEWVRNWLDCQEVDIDNYGRVKWSGCERPNVSKLRTFVSLDYFRHMRQMGVGKTKWFSRSDLGEGFDACLEAIQDGHRVALRASLKHDNKLDPDFTELRRFCECLVDPNSPDFNLAFCGLAHFVWQVKRKVNNLEVQDHLMVILYGPQGCGKTHALAEFLKPLTGYVYEGSVSDVQDPRVYPQYTNNFVARCEELTRIDKTDIGEFKKLISSKDLTNRKLGTHDTITGVQNCTFIGTSNNHVGDIFKDYTGQRRLLQITTRTKKEAKKYWDILNRLDYNKIWRSIPERSKSPLVPVQEDGSLEAHQKLLEAMTSTQQWLEDEGLESGEFSIERNTLRSKYMVWCASNSIRPTPPRYFYEELIKAGLTETRPGANGSRPRVFGCNKQI